MRQKQLRRGGRASTDAGRLSARPGSPSTAGPTGLHRLSLDHARDGLIYIPAGYNASRPAPLAVMLHGAGGNAQHAISTFMSLADTLGLILLAPESRLQTWDVIFGGYGPDVEFIDRALAQTFDRYAVDPSRVAVEGFSDGASYALSIGVTNGDLFTHVIAFSPGFMVPAEINGAPRLFITHGIHDAVLPIQRCSRQIIPRVQRTGYDVLYREFDGPHTVPENLAREAADWFVAVVAAGDRLLIVVEQWRWDSNAAPPPLAVVHAWARAV